MADLITRFTEKYTPEPTSGCWLWTAAVFSKTGYGCIGDGGKLRGAHRVSWELHRGPVGDAWVLHKCDIPACVNPDHLFLGTPKDNTQDMVRKGRASKGPPDATRKRGDAHYARTQPERLARGERVGGAKMSEAAVRECRALYATGAFRLVDLAGKYGLSIASTHALIQRQTWRHVL